MFIRSLQYGFFFWVSLTPSFMSIISTAKVPRILDFLHDCMKGRIRFYDSYHSRIRHAYQAICLSLSTHVCSPAPFLSPTKAQGEISVFSKWLFHNTWKRQRFSWVVFFSDGGVRVVDGGTFAGWRVISRSTHGRIDVVFGPVDATEPHLAISGCQNTFQQHRWNDCHDWGIVFSWSSWSSNQSWAFVYFLRLCAWCWNLFGNNPKLVHMCIWRSHVNSLSPVPSVDCGSPCSTSMVMVKFWVTNVLVMPLHLAHSDLFLATTERLQHIRTNATSFLQGIG